VPIRPQVAPTVSLVGFSQQGLDLSEDLLDRVDIGRVGPPSVSPLPCPTGYEPGASAVPLHVAEGLEGSRQQVVSISVQKLRIKSCRPFRYARVWHTYDWLKFMWHGTAISTRTGLSYGGTTNLQVLA